MEGKYFNKSYIFFNAIKHFFLRIIESKAPQFPVGKLVVGSFGWRNYTIASNQPGNYLGFPQPKIVPEFENLPISLHLGVLGMPG